MRKVTCNRRDLNPDEIINFLMCCVLTDLERRNKIMIRIQIRNHLKPPIQRNNLSLNMFLQYPIGTAIQQTLFIKNKTINHSRNQSNPNLLIKHLQHFLTRTPLQKLTMRLQTSNRLPTRLCRSQFQWRIFWWIILSRFRQCQNDMFDLKK